MNNNNEEYLEIRHEGVDETERRFRKEEYYGWRASEDHASEYHEACKKATEDNWVFQRFKSLRGYRNIIEHDAYSKGTKYFKVALNNDPGIVDRFEKFKINDKIGDSYCSEYGFSNHPTRGKASMGLFSPTTIRYVKVMTDLEKRFGSLDGMRIVEIGGGYGGQCVILAQEYNFAEYTNIDLFWPTKLSEKYVNALGVKNFKTCPIEKIKEENYDLVISNYAFSECNYETQDAYIDKILDNCKNGYITHNTGKDRQNRTAVALQHYENFGVFDLDVCEKKHAIYTWGPLK